MPQRRARWHHYVPQVHLRNFAADAARRFVYRHDKRTDRTRYKAIRGVAARNDYYTVPDDAGDPTDALELGFARIENDVAGVLRRFGMHAVGDLNVSATERAAFGKYVALQFARVPAHVETNRQFAEFIGAGALDMIYATPEHYQSYARKLGSQATDDELENERLAGLALVRSGGWTPPDGHQLAVGAIKDSVQFIGPIVSSMNWSLFRRSRPPWFVLGDAPVSLFASGIPKYLGVGFATEGVEVHMPISPTHVFVATATEHQHAEQVISFDSVETANGMNTEAWANAVYAVFGHSTEAIHVARKATPVEARTFQEPVAKIAGGPPEWEHYKPRR